MHFCFSFHQQWHLFSGCFNLNKFAWQNYLTISNKQKKSREFILTSTLFIFPSEIITFLKHLYLKMINIHIIYYSMYLWLSKFGIIHYNLFIITITQNIWNLKVNSQVWCINYICFRVTFFFLMEYHRQKWTFSLRPNIWPLRLISMGCMHISSIRSCDNFMKKFIIK